MKFRVMLEEPDDDHDCIKDAALKSAQGMKGLSELEVEYLAEIREEEMREFVYQWLEFGHYVTIEFDTEAGSARLLKADAFLAKEKRKQ